MKTHIRFKCIIAILLCFVYSITTQAQCPAGYTRDTLNWDYLDFLPNSGVYVTPTAFITLAQSRTQKFTFGTQQLTITHNYSGGNIGGEVSTHTAETSTYGRGDDLKFTGDGTVTFTFQNPVQNIKFSIADIDNKQRINISALNGAVGTNVSLSTLPGTILSLNNNNTSNARVDASSGAYAANTDNTPLANGTVNVDITGPVTSFTLTVTQTISDATDDGSYYISDVSACSSGTFPLNYYIVSKPYIGQPSYFLAVMNNTIYYVNVANGVARKLFTDAGHTNINSLAYDPYRHMVYYSYSLTGSPVTDKSLRRYDYDMDTLGVMIANVNTIGIPTYDDGVESGAAAFYNGDLYLGVEAGDNGLTNRESTIWKIDFDALYKPINAAQVYALPVDNGTGTGIHDWADIGINDGILYDFDGAAGNTDFYHKDLQTGSVVHYTPSPATLIPRQVSVDWTGKMYNSGSPSSIASGTLVPYNYNGTVDNTQLYTMKYNGVAITGSWGDAGEAFKPKTDYGDAPASYDPPLIDPGTHERNDSIRLGNTIGIEWGKHTSADASGDGAEEDGVSGLQVITTGVSNFLVPVKVLNKTGRNATLAGWVDANGNGKFDPAEGRTMTITSNASIQTINFLWSGINCTLPALSTTFMRFRIATTDQGMTTSTPNGYFDNGEIEDYPVAVSLLLPEQHIDLKAQKTETGAVSLHWETNQEEGIAGYELQRCADARSWETITNRSAAGSINTTNYSYQDNIPAKPVSYYRVKAMKSAGSSVYTLVKKIDFKEAGVISVSPNPAKNTTVLSLQTASAGTATLNILDYTGRIVIRESFRISKGANEYSIPNIAKLSNGVYKIRVKINEDEVLVTSLVILK